MNPLSEALFCITHFDLTGPIFSPVELVVAKEGLGNLLILNDSHYIGIGILAS